MYSPPRGYLSVAAPAFECVASGTSSTPTTPCKSSAPSQILADHYLRDRYGIAEPFAPETALTPLDVILVSDTGFDLDAEQTFLTETFHPLEPTP